MTDPVLRGVAFLMGGYATVMVVIFELALVRGRRRRRAMEASEQIRPRINQALVAHLAGANELQQLSEFQEKAPRELAAAILSYQDAISGSARDSLCELTMQLGLVHKWRGEIRTKDVQQLRQVYAALAFVSAYEPCRRVTDVILAEALDHRDRDVRLLCAQALAEFGDRRTVERIFQLALQETLLGRILLTEPLRRHSMELCRRALPEALQSEDPDILLGALEVILAWERALPISGLEPHFQHPRREIRVAALRCAPFAIATPELEAAVAKALDDSETEVSIAAAAAAARLRVPGALPSLGRCLHSGIAPLARTAAGALAALPPSGHVTLEKAAASEEPVAAAAATEVLSRIRKAGAA